MKLRTHHNCFNKHELEDVLNRLGDGFQTWTIVESVEANVGTYSRHRDRYQTRALKKRVVANVGESVGQHQLCQLSARVKRMGSDVCERAR